MLAYQQPVVPVVQYTLQVLTNTLFVTVIHSVYIDDH